MQPDPHFRADAARKQGQRQLAGLLVQRGIVQRVVLVAHRDSARISRRRAPPQRQHVGGLEIPRRTTQ